MNKEERIKSMLMHIAVGDVLGKICSKYTEEEIISIYGHRITNLEFPIRKGSTRRWYKGAITDDTILTLIVADSLIDKRRFSREDIGMRFLSCDPRGGRQIQKLKDSKNPNFIACDGTTNGAAIRTSPLAAKYDDLEDLTNYTFSLSTLTHGTLEA